MGPTRRALFVIGLSVLSLSLVLSIAPALAAGGGNGGNATTGTVKIRDVASGAVFDDAQNDPQVCTFVVLFQFNDPVETGAWSVQVWPAGSTPTVVASGTYDTTRDGTDETASITLPAGHYRLEWQAVGAHGTKSKTFWVKDGCSSAAPQSDSPTPSPTASPMASPATDAPPASATASPTATAPSGADPSGTPAPDPSDSSVPSPTTMPTGGVEDVTSTATPAPGSQGQVRDATGFPGGTSLPNTSLPEPPTGLLTAIGLLLVLASHPFLRRSARADRR
jgi:hypothetical protein